MLYLKDKDMVLHVRLSEDMYNFIQKSADEYKISKADFIRMLVRSHQVMKESISND